MTLPYETDYQRAERLLRLGLDIAVRIREEDPNAVARAMYGLDYGELRDLALLMAACVDVNRPVGEVVWWTDLDRVPAEPRPHRPCGSHAAYNRHIANGEPVDIACELAERAYQTERGRVRRARARATAVLAPAGLGEDDLGEEGLAA